MQMPADATPQGHHNTGSSWRSRGMSSFTQCTATTATRYPSVSSCKFLLFVGGCWRWRCGQVKPSCLIGEPRQCRQTTRHQGRSSHFHSQQMVIFLLVSPNFHKYGKIFGCFNEFFWRKLSYFEPKEGGWVRRTRFTTADGRRITSLPLFDVFRHFDILISSSWGLALKQESFGWDRSAY